MKTKVENIIKSALVSRLGKEFSTHEFDKMVEYGRMYYDAIHTFATYERIFRKLKANGDIQVEKVKNNSRENTYKIIAVR